MPEIDEDTLRQLMVRSTDDLFAPPAAAAAAIRRQRRHRMRTRVLGAAGTAAAAGVAVGVLVSSGPGPHPAQDSGGASGTKGATGPIQLAAQQTLLSLSAAAAATPRPSGRYVVQAENTDTTDVYPAGTLIPEANGQQKALKHQVIFTETGKKTSVIDTTNGSIITYQDLANGGKGDPFGDTPPAVLNNGPGTEPTNAQLDAEPTGTKALRAALLADAIRQDQPSFMRGPKPTDDDMVFEQAALVLWDPNLSADLRAALYKVLAATPGVEVKSDATDSSGRPAVEISRYEAWSKQEVEAFEDAKTGATLESAWVGPSANYAEDLYLSVTYTNTVPAGPYKS
jgi:hypothetical protein